MTIPFRALCNFLPSPTMRLSCPSCGAALAAEDVNLQTGIVQCRYCGSAFKMVEQAAPAAEERLRPKAPQPKSVTVDQLGNRVTFRHRWFSAKFIFLTFFCLFWDGFLVVWYGLATAGDTPLIFKLFPLIHVAVGVGLTYYTVAGYFNTTTVTLDRDQLSIRHGPLPWPGKRDLSTTSLRQLYCEQKVSHGKNGPSYSYQLNAIAADGTKLKLLTGLDSPEVPQYLEQRMEEFLTIRDQAVAGEHAR